MRASDRRADLPAEHRPACAGADAVCRAGEFEERRNDAQRHLPRTARQTNHASNDGDAAARVSRDHIVADYDQWGNRRTLDATQSCARTHRRIDWNTAGGLLQACSSIVKNRFSFTRTVSLEGPLLKRSSVLGVSLFQRYLVFRGPLK